MVKCPNSDTNNSTNNPLVSIDQVPAIGAKAKQEE